MPEDFKAGFLKALWILRDYLSVIVVGGGWVGFRVSSETFRRISAI
jgi:hypothetical protein